MKKLTVQRLGTANYLRKIEVYCDGQKLGTVGFAARKDFEIPVNSKLVYAQLDWCKSLPITLDTASKDEVLYIECSASLKNALFNASQYLRLHKVERKDLPTQDDLHAFRTNFRKVALTTGLVIAFLVLVGLYSIYVAIDEQAPLWYLLTALAVYNIWRIGRGVRKRLKGEVE